ncbi:hypothetical protein DFS34DRAFT_624459 [Phlyctochytrium arcticum]|nr:hypothetical protein DFS34DRAFT_624459 [Phlyctochytrium arcticum]
MRWTPWEKRLRAIARVFYLHFTLLHTKADTNVSSCFSGALWTIAQTTAHPTPHFCQHNVLSLEVPLWKTGKQSIGVDYRLEPEPKKKPGREFVAVSVADERGVGEYRRVR